MNKLNLTLNGRIISTDIYMYVQNSVKTMETTRCGNADNIKITEALKGPEMQIVKVYH